MLKPYDPKAVTVVFAGIIARGYADGTFVEVQRNSDSFTMMVGPDGDATRAKTNDQSGTVTITLQQSSETNDLFAAMLAADELSSNGAGIGTLMIKDNSGRSIHTAEKAWIKKAADSPYSKDVSTRAWVIETDKLLTFPGGN